MLKEDILKSFLEDELFVEKHYLGVGDAKNFKWTTHTDNNLIHVIKSAIEGVLGNESANVTEKKINTFLNK